MPGDKPQLKIINCPVMAYEQVLALQHRLRDGRRAGLEPNSIIIVEHKPVITFGARQNANRLMISDQQLRDRQIDVVQIRRGGGVTAHNPGQIVFYPILDLRDFGLGASDYVHRLEQIGVELMSRLGVEAGAKNRLPGLWVGDKKIASIGVRVSRMITYHGMAINIRNSLDIFNYMVPCGLDGVSMVSAEQITGRDYDMQDIRRQLAQILTKHFAFDNEVKYENYPTAELA